MALKADFRQDLPRHKLAWGATYTAQPTLTYYRLAEIERKRASPSLDLWVESTAFLVSQHMAAEVAAGEPPPPMPARRRSWAIYETFPTGDGELLFVAMTSNNHWQRFCEGFGLTTLLNDPPGRSPSPIGVPPSVHRQAS